MLPLRELQEHFMSVLFGETSASEPESAARMQIYRNNLRAGFTKALRLEFPVIERLVGSDYFRQLALEFLAAQPSRSGDLHAVGKPLPGYLRRRFDGSEYSYLTDVAALEWAYQEAAIARDVAAFDPRRLAAVEPDDYGRLRFNLHPACLLVHSVYPILRIWQVNQSDSSGEEIVDLAAGADYVLTRRHGEGVELRRTTPGQYALLHAFSRNLPLVEALTLAQRAAPDFDLGCALRESIALGLITLTTTADYDSNQGISP